MTKISRNRDMLTLNYISKGIKTIHIETQLGIFNIHLDVTDHLGRRMEEVYAIGNSYAGQKPVRAKRWGVTKLVELKGVRK